MRLITTMNLCVFVVRCLGVRVTGSEPLTDAVMPPMESGAPVRSPRRRDPWPPPSLGDLS
jgi:hypothetical protein